MAKYYKGFDKDLRCIGFQYELGKTYKEDKAVICEKGFHACENPIDTFNYYSPSDSRYCEVELDSDIKKDNGSSNTKVCAKEIKIGAEIGIKGIIAATINYVFSKTEQVKGVKATTGDFAHAATTGDQAHAVTTGDLAHAATTGDSAHAATTGYSAHAATTGYSAHAVTISNSAHAATTGNHAHAATTGYRAHAATTGDQAHAATTGDSAHAATAGDWAHAAVDGVDSIAFTAGMETKVKGGLGSWIVAAEWAESDDRGGWQIKDIHKAKVDGDNIKPDTWYKVKNGGFVEAKHMWEISC